MPYFADIHFSVIGLPNAIVPATILFRMSWTIWSEVNFESASVAEFSFVVTRFLSVSGLLNSEATSYLPVLGVDSDTLLGNYCHTHYMDCRTKMMGRTG